MVKVTHAGTPGRVTLSGRLALPRAAFTLAAAVVLALLVPALRMPQ